MTQSECRSCCSSMLRSGNRSGSQLWPQLATPLQPSRFPLWGVGRGGSSHSPPRQEVSLGNQLMMFYQEQKLSLYFGLGRGCMLYSFQLAAMLFLASRQIIVTLCICACVHLPSCACVPSLSRERNRETRSLKRRTRRSLESRTSGGNVCVCSRILVPSCQGPREPFEVT